MTVPKVRWHHHIPQADADIACEGERHRLSWRRGKFVLENHDLNAERALLVLGGQPCACLQALRMWRDQFGMPPELFQQMQTWLGPQAVLAPKEMMLPRELGMVLSWERAWHRSSYLDKHGRLIEQWLKERAAGPFRQHLTAVKQRFGSRVISSAHIRAIPATRESVVTGRLDKVAVRAEAALSSDWLVNVWARRIAVVDGAFVLSVVADSLTEPEVLAVRWESETEGSATPVHRQATLGRTDDGWALRWHDGPG